MSDEIAHSQQTMNQGNKISSVRPGMGGTTDLKVGVQNRIRERSERKKRFFVPPLFQMWGYKQANISMGLLNILKFAVWLSH